MREKYDIEALKSEVERIWVEKEKAFPIEKLYKVFETRSAVEKAKIDYDLDELARQRILKITIVKMVEIREDSKEEKERIAKIRKDGKIKVPEHKDVTVEHVRQQDIRVPKLEK